MASLETARTRGGLGASGSAAPAVPADVTALAMRLGTGGANALTTFAAASVTSNAAIARVAEEKGVCPQCKVPIGTLMVHCKNTENEDERVTQLVIACKGDQDYSLCTSKGGGAQQQKFVKAFGKTFGSDDKADTPFEERKALTGCYACTACTYNNAHVSRASTSLTSCKFCMKKGFPGGAAAKAIETRYLKPIVGLSDVCQVIREQQEKLQPLQEEALRSGMQSGGAYQGVGAQHDRAEEMQAAEAEGWFTWDRSKDFVEEFKRFRLARTSREISERQAVKAAEARARAAEQKAEKAAQAEAAAEAKAAAAEAKAEAAEAEAAEKAASPADLGGEQGLAPVTGVSELMAGMMAATGRGGGGSASSRRSGSSRRGVAGPRPELAAEEATWPAGGGGVRGGLWAAAQAPTDTGVPTRIDGRAMAALR